LKDISDNIHRIKHTLEPATQDFEVYLLKL